jgi:THO complex subunit 3
LHPKLTLSLTGFRRYVCWQLQGHSKVIQALGWSCDGKKLATASAASDVRIWSVDSHKEGKEQVLEDHKQSVDGLSWSPTNPDVR